eukprot:12576-Eustigmatos_ZCMA.PRE.1
MWTFATMILRSSLQLIARLCKFSAWTTAFPDAYTAQALLWPDRLRRVSNVVHCAISPRCWIWRPPRH